ncbi:putative Ig domain-containing protein [Arthrobacter sp. HLT1-21]
MFEDRKRPIIAAVIAGVMLPGMLTATPALAAVSVIRAEVSGSALRIEGTAIASRDISVDNVVMGRSDSSGRFRIAVDPYTAPADCTLDLRDGSATVTTRTLTGCTVTRPPSSDTTAPSVPANLTATVTGTTVSLSWGLSSDATGVTGYRVHRNGTSVGTTTATSFTDSGLGGGTYTYTVAAFDAAGNTSGASNTASATVSAPDQLTFLTPAQMPDATVGQVYLGYIVCSDPPGPSIFRFKLVTGTVPDGTRYVRNTLENRPETRVIGTPTQAGTFTFTVEVQDNTGATARRTFTIRVLPA